ncbi:16S rRNA (cytosine(967)-C(5))-methyltransferase RsmB [Anoxynatronum buryatiense]|uniref:16S rRNA (cytosine(967)-C(5))-methyltransferase n=1 Tax=Anoxynatronum buryatiense TaxID=489973 RepID=A0AA45WUF7_9CLOT|nr:16S rRNA (cytosine(967)-C(5))-methyltransferase RsmB [Anoxynatronum buryatiense]SMP46886.1 NusB antitermination factor [Anoxynatronum buryatiense]
MKISPREAAAHALENILTFERFSNRETGRWLEKGWWSDEDQRLFLLLVYGSLEQLLQLDQLIATHARRPVDKLDPFLRGILRISAYQLCFTDRIPAYAVINEAVELAKKKKPKAAGLVNAVLRAITRSGVKNRVSMPIIVNDNIQALSLRYSHPLWLVELLHQDYSWSDLKTMLAAHQQPPSLTVRLNLQKGKMEDLLLAIGQEGIELEPLGYIPEAFKVTTQQGLITHSDVYRRGLFHIQSLASMMAVHWLDPQPGERIIDMAAAPGGKATFIAQRMKGRGMVMARDISVGRIQQIQDNARRLGCNELITCQEQDGRKPDPEMIQKADRVLLDAPCSSLGMIRKKPELKYIKNWQRLRELPQLQYQMLENAGKMVRNEGVLVYSTCTYLRRENDAVLERFLDNHPNFKLEPLIEKGIHDSINDLFTETIVSKGFIQLGPHVHMDFDGFFVARMKRTD